MDAIGRCKCATVRAVLCCLLVLPAGTGLAAEGAKAETKAAAAARDGQGDFDFEFGAWTVRLSRLLKPLSGSKEWVEYEGLSVVRKVWGGRANLGELTVEGASGRIEGMSLRLYNPQTRQWRIHWANSRDGMLGEAMKGGFDDNGRGLFLNEDEFDGRPVLVRFIFADITADAFRLEQAFSADGGKTWEANWIARFTRVQEQ